MKKLAVVLLSALLTAALLWGASTAFGDFIAIPRGTGAGETGRVRFRELAAGGTQSVDLKAPDSLAATYTYTLPNAYPASNDMKFTCTTAGVCSWATDQTGGGGGGGVLVETQTASNSASVNFTSCISSTYDTYKIEIINLRFENDSIYLMMRMSTDGGSSYDSTADIYGSALWGTSQLGGGAGGSDNTLDHLRFWSLGPGADTGNAAYASNVSMTLWNPTSTTYYKFIGGHSQFIESNDLYVATFFSGGYKNTTAVNAFQFLASDAGTGGDIATGTFRCYGVAK